MDIIHGKTVFDVYDEFLFFLIKKLADDNIIRQNKDIIIILKIIKINYTL